MRATVLGSGSFGTALCNVLAQNFDEVRTWDRDASVIEGINQTHENARYLPGIALSKNIRGTTDLSGALEGSEFVLSAIPSQATREVLLKATPMLKKGVPLITVAKGIENETLLTMTEVMESVLPEEFHPYVAVLSGPSFAKELAMRAPTVVTIASHWDKVALRCQKAFQTDTFRSYTSSDVVGVQMGGALKNVIAIAAGISDGLGFGHNARAAIITRGLAEITRMAVRRGANPLTLSGLSGMGDLVLTCTGELSRNRTVGLQLGAGKTLTEIMGGMNQVAEGVKTANSAHDLSTRTGVDMPISNAVYAICYDGKSARQTVAELMSRPAKSELV